MNRQIFYVVSFGITENNVSLSESPKKMAETKLRRRLVDEDKASSQGEKDKLIESETDDKPTVTEDIAKTIGQDKPPDALDQALGGLPPRWKNWVIRGIFTWLMIGGFCLIIYGGPLALMITVFLVQVKVLFYFILSSSASSCFSVSLRSSTLAMLSTRWTTSPGLDLSLGIF